VDIDSKTSAIVVTYRDARTRGVLLITLGVLLTWIAVLVDRDLKLDAMKTIVLYGIPAAMTIWGILRLVVKRELRGYGISSQGSGVMLGQVRLDMRQKYGGEFYGCRSIDATNVAVRQGDMVVDVALLNAKGMYSVVAVMLSQNDVEGTMKPLATVARDGKSFARFGLIFLVTNGRCYGLGGKVGNVREWMVMLHDILESAFPGVRASKRLLLYPDTADWFANTMTFGLAGAIASGAFDASKRESAAREVAEGELRHIADELGWKLEAGG
jgi:hypothetical protein